MKRFILGLIAFVSIALLAYGGFAATSEFKTTSWEINESGDLVPLTDSTYDLGESGSEVANLYIDAITLGGVEYTSLAVGSDGNWTGDGTTTVLDSAPTKFIATHSTGQFFATQLSAGTGDIVLENGQVIDGGTNNAIKLTENSDTASITFSGNDIVLDSTDGGYIFTLTDATDGTLDIMTNNDADDYIQISTSGDQPVINFVGCNGSITAASGSISFSNENLSTTGTLSSGATTVTSLIIGDDTYDVSTDDMFTFSSNDNDSTIEAYGYDDKAGILRLTADRGDDGGDTFEIQSSGSDTLLFTNDTAEKGTQATIMTLAASGIVTTTNDIIIVNDSATTNAVQDVLRLTSTTTGTAAAGLGAGMTFYVEDSGGSEEQASLDVALTTATNGSENADVIVNQNTAGGIAETLRLVALSSATTSDYLQFTANTTETDAATNVLVLKTSTGTATDNYGMSISFQPEDATGSEEVASLDIIETTADRATNDTDFVFSQNINGTITETMRLDADAGLDLSGTTWDIILPNDETINNDTDDTVQITSNDTNATLQVLGAEASSAILSLDADLATDDTDTWTFTVADGGALTIANDGTATATINEVVAFGSGNTNSVVTVTDAASYSVLAANSGKVHVIGNLSQNTTIKLPAEAAGLYYKFIFCAAADEADDHNITSENDTNFFIGGVAFADTDAGSAGDEINAGVYADGDSNSILTINNASAGTSVEFYCDGTNWYVNGTVYSDTVPSFANQS